LLCFVWRVVCAADAPSSGVGEAAEPGGMLEAPAVPAAPSLPGVRAMPGELPPVVGCCANEGVTVTAKAAETADTKNAWRKVRNFIESPPFKD
jgi:hypothetical protein